MTDEDAQKYNTAFMIEHPDAFEALSQIAQEYGGRIAHHVVTTAMPPLEINDTVVRHLTTEQPLAIIKPDGAVTRLDREED